MIRVLITGAAGFLASHVYGAFSKRRYDIWGVDNLSTGKIENMPQKRLKQLEVIDVASVDLFKVFEEVKPDIVLHLAAQPSLLTSHEKPYVDAAANIMGTINIGRLCRTHEVERLVFTSTSAVMTAEHQEEETPILWEYMPDSPYGISKLSAEMYVKYFMPEKHIILRLGNVYGENQVPLGENQLIPRAIRFALGKDDFEVYGDGEATRDYIHASDGARAIFIASTKKNVSGTFNIGTGEQHSAIQVLGLIHEAMGFSAGWPQGEAREDRGDVLLNVDKARDILGFESKIPLRKGIERTVRWWRAQG